MRAPSLSFIILAITLCASASVRAQQDAATIVGEVTDASRGVVPKAGVVVTNTATGITADYRNERARSVQRAGASSGGVTWSSWKRPGSANSSERE